MVDRGEINLRSAQQLVEETRDELSKLFPTRITLEVVYACDEKWDEMEGDETARFCERCKHSVHDLTEKTREQVEALVDELGQDFCGRFNVRPDGRVAFGECHPPAPMMLGRVAPP